MKKKNLVMTISMIVLALIIIAGSTYAFFELTVNNENHATVDATTKLFSLNFVDGPVLNIEDALPGATFIKKFTIENIGTDTSYYTIFIDDVLNEFANKDDVVYSLSGTYSKEEKTFPVANSVVLENIEIPVNETHEYTMTIKYLNRNEDQNIDMNKKITGTIQIKEGLKKYNINGIAYDNNGNLITDGYAEVHSDVQRVPIDATGHFSFVDVPVGEHTITFFNHEEEEIKSQEFELVRTKLDNNKVEEKVVGGGKEKNSISLLFDVKPNEIEIQLMPPSYTLNVIVNNGTSSKNNVEMFEGHDSEVISLSPNEHYGFKNVTCTNNQVPKYANGNLYIENPTDNTTCTVDFEASDYTIYFVTDDNGTTNISNTSVKYTENGTATLIPNIGYHYENISCTNNQTASVSDDIITVSNVSSDTTCTITFAINNYTINFVSNDLNMGTITDSSKQSEHGSSTQTTFTPTTGYHFDNIVCTNDKEATISDNVINISNITSDLTCTVNFKINNYNVSFALNDSSYGTLSTTNNLVNHGQSTVTTVTPKTGYHYASVSCTNNQTVSYNNGIITVSNITSDTTCTISLAINTYTVSFVSNNTNYGTVADASKIVNYNSSTTTTITPKTGYHYESVSCTGGSVSGSTVTVSNVTDNITCTVNFAINTYTVSFVSNNTNYGTLSSSGTTVNHGQSTVTTATPKTGYHYASVSCTNGQTATYSNGIITAANLTNNTTCTVDFAINTYTVSFVSNNTNYGTVADASKTVNHGSSTSTTITPKTGYHYASLSCTGGSVSGSTVTVSNVTGNVTCTVNFAINTYTVSFVSNNTNYGTVADASKTVNYGSSTSTTFSAKTGYHYNNLSCTGGSVSGSTVTVSNVTGNVTCTVNFAINTYTVTFKPNNTNYGTVANASKTVNHGSSTSTTFSAKTGYHYNNLSCTGGSVSGSTVTVSNVTGNITCTVNFAINTYTVTFNVTNGTGATNKTVNHGSTTSITSAPNSNYSINTYSCNNNVGLSKSGNTFTTGAITANTTCTITYKTACAYSAGQTWTYNYTGNIQSFTVPTGCPGTYKLEVWGAQGGNHPSGCNEGNGTGGTGGKGGYSQGQVSLNAGTVLYIGVGGQGAHYTGDATNTGGYNGGGTKTVTHGFSWDCHASGGGATHIGKTNALLKNTSAANLYIVAGGGGGAAASKAGGAGGGTNGSNGVADVYGGIASGGSQSAGGSAGQYGGATGAFGQGGNYNYGYYGGLGGGGYYGGGASAQEGGGGGGSGYIGGVTSGSMSNGQRSGNGTAKITLVSLK